MSDDDDVLDDDERGHLLWCKPAEIDTDTEWNVRDAGEADPVADAELRADIERRGLLQPLVIYEMDGRLKLAAGFRRHAQCARIDADREVPCFLRSFDQLALDRDLEVAGANVAENLQRQRLRPHEIAEVLHRTHKQRPDLSVKDMASLFGMSETWIRRLLAVRQNASTALWSVVKRYGKQMPRGIRFQDVVEISKRPHYEQIDAWNRLIDERDAKRRRRAPSRRLTARELRRYLDCVEQLSGSADFKAGVRFGLRVCLKQQDWPDTKQRNP